MPSPLTIPPRTGHQSFLYAPVDTNLEQLRADIAFIGLPYGSPYSILDVANDQSNAPTAVRQATDRAVRALERYDFDLGGPVFDNRDIRMVDCGDVPADPRDLGGHYRRAEAAIRLILKAGALPLIIGGDHGVPIPVLRAFDNHGPITLVHVDAHLDWRDEVDGVKDGYSSPIRRASEMKHVKDIFQIGIRAQGSARSEEVRYALDHGANIVTAWDLHEKGIGKVIDMIPDGGRYYISIDADGLDPSFMPAVAGPSPGGVTFPQARALLHALVRKGRVVGMDIVEITPSRDVNRITSISAGRLFVNVIGAAVRADYFRKRA
jgi:agmatinase